MRMNRGFNEFHLYVVREEMRCQREIESGENKIVLQISHEYSHKNTQ